MRLALIVACFLTGFAAPAAAQALQCASRAAVLEALAKQSQTRRAIGIAGQAVMEMFASDETGRWTVTVTLPDGRMCRLAHGIAFEPTEGVFPASGTRL